MKHIYLFLIGICLILSLSSVNLSAQPSIPLQNGLQATGGAINAIAPADDGSVYIGGDFTRLSYSFSSTGAPISTANSAPLAPFPAVSGNIYTVAADGDNGWYIGGDFTSINGVTRNRIAHIFSDGTLDNEWNPNANGTVYTLVVSADGSAVFAGGGFTHIGHANRNYIAALNNTNGNASSWNPNANSTISSLAISPDESTIYVGGAFTTIGGQARSSIAALDMSTSAATSWDASGSGTVYALAVSGDGNTIYAGGSFINMGGTAVGYIAAINADTGLSTAQPEATWTTNAQANTFVNTLALNADDSILYVGSAFTTIGGGATRTYIAALGTDDGLATNWDPGSSATVSTLKVINNTVYAGGSFGTIGGQSRAYIAALNADDGSVTPDDSATAWDPSANSTVYALAFNEDNTFVYAGGSFSVIGGVRNRIAHILADGTLDPDWNPNANSSVYALAINGSTVYAGGAFTTIGENAVSRMNIAAIDSDGNATEWDPNANSNIRTIAISGSTIYAGGNFTTIGANSQSRSYIAALNATTGDATNWDPGSSSIVYSLAVTDDGNTVYAGGTFTTIGANASPTRNRLAALDATTGDATSWDPDSSGTINTIAINDSTIYVGGTFNTIGANNQSRNNIAAIESTTGNATTWNPNAFSDVNTLAVSNDGNTIYAGGVFVLIGQDAQVTRNRIAAIDATTGNPTLWNPDADALVYAIALNSNNSTIYVGGNFTTMQGETRGYLAQFGPASIDFDEASNGDSESETSATIIINLSEESTEDITFDYTIAGTATNGVDYTLSGDAGTATILAGDLSTTITLTVTNDLISEADETVILTLTDSSNADLGITNTTYTYTILDNDDPTCGNLYLEGDEACDGDGVGGGSNSNVTANACRTDCTLASCGDGVTDSGETCDDGDNNGDANMCNSNCTGATASVCGNDAIEAGETCDDGDLNGEPTQCNDTCTDTTTPVCGNEVLETDEACDDGNTENDDGCNHLCGTEVDNSNDTHALEGENAETDFETGLEVGDEIPLSAPDPRTSSDLNVSFLIKKATLPDTCTCSWSANPESIGIYDDAAACETALTLEEAVSGTLTVSVDCGAEGSGVYTQALTVHAVTATASTDTSLGFGGGCGLNR